MSGYDPNKETPAERLARKKREREEYLRKTEEARQKRLDSEAKQQAANEAGKAAEDKFNSSWEKEMNDALLDILGADIDDLDPDGMIADLDKKAAESYEKMMRHKSKADKGGWGAKGHANEAKKIAKQNKKKFAKAAENNKKTGCFLFSMLLIGAVLTVLTGVGWGAYTLIALI